MTLAITKGTVSARDVGGILDTLKPNEVLFDGELTYFADGVTARWVWDAGLNNIRPMTAAEEAAVPAQQKATRDAAEPALAALRNALVSARATNAAFLALNNPGLPGVTAQVQALTAQHQTILDALARLVAKAGV